MKVSDILLLGDPRLYEVCDPVLHEELSNVSRWQTSLHEAMEDIRKTYGFGRAIAAPQLGIMKRLIYMNIEQPKVLINPIIVDKSKELFQLWDDCMSFPHLLVHVSRYKRVTLEYLDVDWQIQRWTIEDDLSELLQHEIDHLDGILCTMRAIDDQSFKWRQF